MHTRANDLRHRLPASDLIRRAADILAGSAARPINDTLSDYLGVSVSTVRRWRRINQIPKSVRELLTIIVTGIVPTWSKEWHGARFAPDGALYDACDQAWRPRDLQAYRYQLAQLAELKRRNGPAQLEWRPALDAMRAWRQRYPVANAGPADGVYNAVRAAVQDELRAQGLRGG